MSPAPRKPRPLIRDATSLRDDRLFIVACDDSFAPKQYFSFFRLPRIQVHVVATPQDKTTCHAQAVLQRLEQVEHEDDDERWLLLDTDHYTTGPHVKAFKKVLTQAKQKEINVALSKPCFELWLLLHHEEIPSTTVLPDAQTVEKRLRATLGEYNKTRLKETHYPLSALALAYRRAMALDKKTKGGMIPSTPTSRVYLLWQAIFSQIQPWQLPLDLQGP
jgi:hypothetical protein